jgi:hypothetical protein
MKSELTKFDIGPPCRPLKKYRHLDDWADGLEIGRIAVTAARGSSARIGITRRRRRRGRESTTTTTIL